MHASIMRRLASNAPACRAVQQASMPLQVGLVIDLTNTDRYYGTGDMGNEFAYHQQQFDGEPIHHIKAGASTAALAVAATQMQLTCQQCAADSMPRPRPSP